MFFRYAIYFCAIFSSSFAHALNIANDSNKSTALAVTCSNSYHLIASTSLHFRKSCQPDCSFKLLPGDYLELGHIPIGNEDVEQ